MTITSTLNPQIVGQAENAHLPVLKRILARTGTTKNQWVALTLTTAAGGVVERNQLISRLADALKVDIAAAASAISELTAARLMEDGEESQVGLTGSGQARFHEIRSAVDEVIGRVYRDIPAEDLATAGRVLTLLTDRLNSETASA